MRKALALGLTPARLHELEQEAYWKLADELGQA
jgi:hypothetical protein